MDDPCGIVAIGAAFDAALPQFDAGEDLLEPRFKRGQIVFRRHA